MLLVHSLRNTSFSYIKFRCRVGDFVLYTHKVRPWTANVVVKEEKVRGLVNTSLRVVTNAGSTLVSMSSAYNVLRL